MTAFLGLLVSTVCATAAAWLLNATGVLSAEASLISSPLLKERLTLGWFSVVAALAAGVAGAIAIAQGKLDTLVGVVAALALVPAAAAGVALLAQDYSRAAEGLLLLCVNVLCTVVTGGVTLLVVRPDEES